MVLVPGMPRKHEQQQGDFSASAPVSPSSGAEQGGDLVPPGEVPGAQGSSWCEPPGCPEPWAPLSTGGVTDPRVW